MRVILDGAAIADLEEHVAWIAKESPQAAAATVAKIFQAIERLEIFPRLGHEGRTHGTYERVVSGTPYIIVYELWEKPDAVIVTAIFHGAQDR